LGEFSGHCGDRTSHVGLLADACPKPEFAAAQFELYQLSNFQSPMEEGVSLYLYRVAVNGARRNLPPTVGPDGHRYRPPNSARPALRRQRLGADGGQTTTAPRLGPANVRRRADPADRFAESLWTRAGNLSAGETVEVLLESLLLQDWNNLWRQHHQKLSTALVGYVARMIGISSTMALADAAPVQTREFKSGRTIDR